MEAKSVVADEAIPPITPPTVRTRDAPAVKELQLLIATTPTEPCSRRFRNPCAFYYALEVVGHLANSIGAEATVVYVFGHKETVLYLENFIVREKPPKFV